MGESSWMWPEWLEKGDNVQLAMNIFNWLAGKEIEKLNRDEIKKNIDPNLD